MKERSVPIRPGIEDHLVRGTLSAEEFGIYVLIHLQADFRTGIWHGSAPRILATVPRGASLRKVQRVLERFESVGYLKSFRQQGARGNTAYLIDKFTVRSGALKGYRLNAAKSDSWRRPRYELVAEDDAETVAVTVADSDALSRSKKKEVRSKTPAAKPAPPADTRFQQFVDFAHKSFQTKHGQKPSWNSRDFKALSELLASNRSATLAELQRRWEHYVSSTESFTAKQGDSLAYFCPHFDSFISGPLHSPGREKLSGTDIARANLKNAGFIQ